MARYRRTRGGVRDISFEVAVFMGLGKDRGLIVPEVFPSIKKEHLEQWKVWTSFLSVWQPTFNHIVSSRSLR